MTVSLHPAKSQQSTDLLSHAKELFSQQVWCWGRDICRKEGNWLLKCGFQRSEPSDTEKMYSAYTLDIPHGRSIILRGSGVFYGDVRYGGVFIPRYQFTPKYVKSSNLANPHWSKSDLDQFRLPNKDEKSDFNALLTGLISWIKAYEQNIIDCIGMDYRRSSLTKWDNGERIVIPCENIIEEWNNLAHHISKENLL
tara:strand:+ start:51 stop:638 length:588 start_codon:yes stop_codon:yes gene_type:complete